MLFTATPDILSSSENINSAAVFPDFLSVSYDYDNVKEYSYFWFGISAKIGTPKPPNFEGSDNSFLSILEQCIPPLIPGRYESGCYYLVKSSSILFWTYSR